MEIEEAAVGPPMECEEKLPEEKTEETEEAVEETIVDLHDQITPKKEPLIDDMDGLVSMECLDRTSPEMWPEQNFISKNTLVPPQPPMWTRGLSSDDISQMFLLGALSSTGLVAEIKKLYEQSYQLGTAEAKEMTRGKYLDVFANNQKKKL